jgi:hypothetical protein
MAVTVTQRSVITEDVPSRLLALTLPPGVTLDKWVEMETARLRHAYPKPKVAAAELGLDYAEMLRVARHNRNYWAERYELLKLDLREELAWAKKGTVNGIPFVDRRQFPVNGYAVESYEQDALFPV